MSATLASAGPSRVSVPWIPAAGLSVATGGAFVLGVAGVLGTASDDGLPTCLFLAATGAPCPFCGLTHGVAALGAGDIAAAVALNPLAPLAVVLALAVGVTLLRRRRLAVPALALWALAGVVLLTWLARLVT